jgi:3D (Asp-Asp-Asp) domain-containing protein
MGFLTKGLAVLHNFLYDVKGHAQRNHRADHRRAGRPFGWLVLVVIASSLFFECAGVRPAPEVGEIPEPISEELQGQRQLLGSFSPTFYCLADEADSRYAGLPADADILDIYGRTIARVSQKFKRKADLEGSARLLDGRVINFAGRAPDGIRYRMVFGADYGLGAANAEYISRVEPYRLIPYRSVAVDVEQIPMGSVLYIPEAEGIVLPDGEKHDGYFLAHDVGAAIKFQRIDLFVGAQEDVRNTFTSNGLSNMSPIRVYLVLEPLAEEIRSRYRSRYTLTAKPVYRMTWSDIDMMLANLSAAVTDPDQRIQFLSEVARGTPYLIFCLGEGPSGLYDKDPLVDIARVDCMTFCEQILAMAISRSYEEFFRNLQRIRYRDGIVDFKMRNHYTIADWLPNNAWLLEDATELIGGPYCRAMTKTVDRARDFMAMGCTDLRGVPPPETMTVKYIPKEHLLDVEEHLRGGEIVSLIQHREGILSSHMALIAKDREGNIIFRHASRTAGEVVDEAFGEYVQKIQEWKNTAGMMFMRVRRDYPLAGMPSRQEDS